MSQIQAASFFAAALMTLALFSGTGAAAGHQARQAAATQADRDAPVMVAATQQVTIIGHRQPA